MEAIRTIKKQRVHPQLISADLPQPASPAIETVIGCQTCSLDKKFERVFPKTSFPHPVIIICEKNRYQ